MARKTSLDRMMGGALHEIFNRELSIVAANICDPNTSAKDKRQITIKLTVEPDEDRQIGKVTASIESKLSPVKSVKGKFVFGYDAAAKTGEAAEFNGGMLGQIDIDDYNDMLESEADTGGNVIDLRAKKGVV